MFSGKAELGNKKIRTQNCFVKIVAVSAHERGNLALRKAGADAICGILIFRQIEAVVDTVMKSYWY